MFTTFQPTRATGKSTRAKLQAALLLSEGKEVVLVTHNRHAAKDMARGIACMLPMATCNCMRDTLELNGHTLRVVSLTGLAELMGPGQRPTSAVLVVDL
jgi:hypothetical protein